MLSLVSVQGLSLVAASGGHSSSRCAGLSLSRPLVAEHRLQMRRLSNCGSRAQLLRGMWDLPRPGLEPVSPALAGRFSTTAPPGKPKSTFLLVKTLIDIWLLKFLSSISLLEHVDYIFPGHKQSLCSQENKQNRVEMTIYVWSSSYILH